MQRWWVWSSRCCSSNVVRQRRRMTSALLAPVMLMPGRASVVASREESLQAAQHLRQVIYRISFCEGLGWGI